MFRFPTANEPKRFILKKIFSFRNKYLFRQEPITVLGSWFRFV